MIKLKDACWNHGAISEWLAIYMIWSSASYVIACINSHLQLYPDTDEFCIILPDNDFNHKVGVRIYDKNGTRFVALFPCVYNTTLKRLTGDDWETEIYAEDLDD